MSEENEIKAPRETIIKMFRQLIKTSYEIIAMGREIGSFTSKLIDTYPDLKKYNFKEAESVYNYLDEMEQYDLAFQFQKSIVTRVQSDLKMHYGDKSGFIVPSEETETTLLLKRLIQDIEDLSLFLKRRMM